MYNPIKVTDIDPDDPRVITAISLITAYQLGTLSDAERLEVEQRLRTDQEFQDIVEPILFCGRLTRETGDRQRAALDDRAKSLTERVIARVDAQVAEERQRKGVRSPSHTLSVSPVSTPKPLSSVRRPGTIRKRGFFRRTMQRLYDSTATYVIVGTLSATVWVYDLYAAEVRLRTPPATVTFENAPLSTVAADISHRYDIDVSICGVGFKRDTVTLTMDKAPVDTVLQRVSDQTLRWAHWVGPHTVHLDPQPDVQRGAGYNLKLFFSGWAAAYTGWGCHR